MNAHELIAELTQALAEHKAAKWGLEGVTDVNDTKLHDRADRAVALYQQESRRHSEKLANLLHNWRIPAEAKRKTDKRITAVAISYKKGRYTYIFDAPPPQRHHDILRDQARDIKVMKDRGYVEVQGFIINDNEFVDRSEAYKIASANGQLLPRKSGYDGPELFSEDLW